jgi:hypothetical protein
MEKKQPKIAIVGAGPEDEAQVALLKEKLGDDVVLMDPEEISSDFQPLKVRRNTRLEQVATMAMMLTPGPEFIDPRSFIDDDWNKLSKSDRRGTVANVRNSKEDPKIQRNALCPCGSGKKYKKCCGK